MEDAAREEEAASDCADLDPHGPWRLCCLCWQPVGDDIESHGIPVVDCIECDWPIHWECCKHTPNKCGWRNRPARATGGTGPRIATTTAADRCGPRSVTRIAVGGSGPRRATMAVGRGPGRATAGIGPGGATTTAAGGRGPRRSRHRDGARANGKGVDEMEALGGEGASSGPHGRVDARLPRGCRGTQGGTGLSCETTLL